MIKPFRLLRAWGVGSWLLILMSAGITMRRRLFRGFIIRSKNFSRCLSSGLRASPGANAPFTWLRSPSHWERFEVHSDSAGRGLIGATFQRFNLASPRRFGSWPIRTLGRLGPALLSTRFSRPVVPSRNMPSYKFLPAERNRRACGSAVSHLNCFAYTEMVRPGGVQHQSGQHRAAFRQAASKRC